MATLRPISADELSTATLGVVSCLGWLGLLLLGATMIGRADRLTQLFDRVVLAGGLLALLGLAQFFFHQTFIDIIQIPGLSATQPIYGVQSREGFTRPAGTAIHPIEFGVVLTTVLPMAIARAIDGRELRPVRRYFPASAILLAILLSVSRSALVCAAVGIIVCIPGWPRRARGPIMVACGGLGVLVFLTVPGMLGSILGLFSGIGTDSSAQSRVDSWGFALHYFAESPILGRGFATFLPKYHILDNQYLLLLVEMGVVGLVAVLALVASGLRSAFAAASFLPPESRVQPIALAGGIAAAASSLALFDAFSFPMVPGLLFLLLGMAGGWLGCSAAPSDTGVLAAVAGRGESYRC
ncbi:O-antigen ligase [Friedmanniella endophytica]|uniref:O-antigen ligase n=2 Tax=Microlunatus kandeliicorticis TaxID=1759536 RepID=A0A7W3IPA3_9ACTN|nr:O-antigen ligase [Microlunatus kandeliicorticis]